MYTIRCYPGYNGFSIEVFGKYSLQGVWNSLFQFISQISIIVIINVVTTTVYGTVPTVSLEN